jgi:hypothetical protein
MAGLVNPNIRLPGLPEPELPEVIIEAGEDVPDMDVQGNILRIEHDDGSIFRSVKYRANSDPSKMANATIGFV